MLPRSSGSHAKHILQLGPLLFTPLCRGFGDFVHPACLAGFCWESDSAAVLALLSLPAMDCDVVCVWEDAHPFAQERRRHIELMMNQAKTFHNKLSMNKSELYTGSFIRFASGIMNLKLLAW